MEHGDARRDNFVYIGDYYYYFLLVLFKVTCMKEFFKGLSFTQICAGCLAAVTSFLLAAKIGIAGSAIGVAVGSIVSTVASQIYQNVIRASSRRIQSSESQKHEEVAMEDTTLGTIVNDTEKQKSEIDAHAARVIASSPQQEALEHTRVMELSALREKKEEDMALADGGFTQDTMWAPRDHQQYAPSMSHSDTHYKRVVLIVAVVSALVAVLLTAAVVLMVTQGKGTDTVPPMPNKPVEQPQQQIQPRTRKPLVRETKPNNAGNDTGDARDNDEQQSTEEHVNSDSLTRDEHGLPRQGERANNGADAGSGTNSHDAGSNSDGATSGERSGEKDSANGLNGTRDQEGSSTDAGVDSGAQ